LIRFYTSERLGTHQSLTPDGFLLCQDVPIARTGILLYAAGEVPVDADSDGIIRILREPEEVFTDSAIASFNGKPICNDHPPDRVSPDNWRSYSVGVVLNPRRGDGLMFDNDYLYADLLVTDKFAIQDVREGKREVSAGYDADYEQLRPGEGRQHMIVGNHVALVDKGRCGPRCSIGDKEMATTAKRPAWFDRIMQAVKTGDEDRLVDTLEKVQEMLGETWLGEASGRIRQGDSVDSASRDNMAGGVHVHLHHGGAEDVSDNGNGNGNGAEAAAQPENGNGNGSSLEEVLQRLAALERAVAILAQEEGEENGEGEAMKNEPEEESAGEATKEEGNSWQDRRTRDKATKDTKALVGDSTSLRGPWQELLSRAEVLAPGIKPPTFDTKMPAKQTVDSMCQFRRKVLGEAMKEDDTKGAIVQLAGEKPNFTQLTCDAVQLLFNGASELVRQANSRRTITDMSGGHNYNTAANASLLETVRSINQKNRDQYGIKA